MDHPRRPGAARAVMPIVRPLSDAEIEHIHAAGLEVPATVGFKVAHDGLLRRLRAAGAKRGRLLTFDAAGAGSGVDS